MDLGSGDVGKGSSAYPVPQVELAPEIPYLFYPAPAFQGKSAPRNRFSNSSQYGIHRIASAGGEV
jgi:hypothetical protein